MAFDIMIAVIMATPFSASNTLPETAVITAHVPLVFALPRSLTVVAHVKMAGDHVGVETNLS